MLGLFASCGGGNSITLEVEPQLGELGNFITPTETEVTVSLTDDKDDGKDIKRVTSSIAFNVKKAVVSNYSFGLSVVILDALHNEITTLPDYKIESTSKFSDGSYVHILSEGPVRAQMNYTEDAEEWNGEAQKMWEKVQKEGKYLVIKIDNPFAHFEAYNSSDSSTSSSDSTTEREEME